jgi:hypothetical protein
MGLARRTLSFQSRFFQTSYQLPNGYLTLFSPFIGVPRHEETVFAHG